MFQPVFKALQWLMPEHGVTAHHSAPFEPGSLSLSRHELNALLAQTPSIPDDERVLTHS